MTTPDGTEPVAPKSSWGDALSRSASLLRYHRPSQFYWRCVRLLERRLFRTPSRSIGNDLDAGAITLRNDRGLDAILNRRLAWRRDRPEFDRDATSLQHHQFRFLGETRTLGVPMDWKLARTPPASHLWRFHLHYQEYLLDLLAIHVDREDVAARDLLWDIVDDWIKNSPLTRQSLDDAWHPFCISRRIPVWLLLWRAADPPSQTRDAFVASLETQARYLESHLERDLGGNHLLENLRALVLMGAFVESPRAEVRLDRATRLFVDQLDRQILGSGEHFERSPMYHAQMLEAVADVRDATVDARPQVSASCAEVVGRMARFLAGILHPDGEIPLFGDSALGESAAGDRLLTSVCVDVSPQPSEPSSAAVNVGDYWTWREGAHFLVFDAGPVGADELPAHAHCDLLTLEASIGGQRLFVDSGVREYDGPTRAYCRSTAAHNVLQVDDVEQCEVWSRFRMGYRGHPTSFDSGTARGFDWCSATHDAYRRLNAPVVGRWLACRPNGPWLCVDWARGTGRRWLTSRLHLHPQVGLSNQTETSIELVVGGARVHLRVFAAGALSVRPAPYFPEFGREDRSHVIEMVLHSELPAALVWGLTWGEAGGRAMHEFAADGQQQISWCEAGSVATWEVSAG